MLTLSKSVNLLVRFLLELFALGTLGYWGFAVGGSVFTKILLGIGAPLLAAVVWGLFVAPRAAVLLKMPLRLVPEALVFGSAILALFATGHPRLGTSLLIVAAANRALVLAWE